jgi:predicted nicotinamide N-methyase
MISALVSKLRCGATQIVSTDGCDDTVALMHSNIADCGCGQDVDVCKLYWGDHAEFIAKYPMKFDTILAADVIYEDEQIVPLISTVVAIMHPDGGEFILAYARRNVPIDKVLKEAEKNGLVYEIIDHDDTTEHIYRFTFRQ